MALRCTLEKSRWKQATQLDYEGGVAAIGAQRGTRVAKPLLLRWRGATHLRRLHEADTRLRRLGCEVAKHVTYFFLRE